MSADFALAMPEPVFIKYRRRGLTVGECYFEERPARALPRVDLLR